MMELRIAQNATNIGDITPNPHSMVLPTNTSGAGNQDLRLWWHPLQLVLGKIVTSWTNKHRHVLVYAAIARHIGQKKIMGCVIPNCRIWKINICGFVSICCSSRLECNTDAKLTSVQIKHTYLLIRGADSLHVETHMSNGVCWA